MPSDIRLLSHPRVLRMKKAKRYIEKLPVELIIHAVHYQAPLESQLTDREFLLDIIEKRQRLSSQLADAMRYHNRRNKLLILTATERPQDCTISQRLKVFIETHGGVLL